jgi:flagellin-like protein
VIVAIMVMNAKGVSEVVGTLMAVLITFALVAVAFNFITAATVKNT